MLKIEVLKSRHQPAVCSLPVIILEQLFTNNAVWSFCKLVLNCVSWMYPLYIRKVADVAFKT